MGLQAGNLIGGSILIETVFAWPGTGFLLNSAIFRRDLPILQGTTLVLAGFFMLLNLTVRNDGNYLATVNLSASAPAGIVLHFDAASLQVPPFSEQVVVVTIEPAPDFPAWASGVVYFTATLGDMPVSAITTLNFTMKQRYELTLGGDSAATALPGSRVIFNLIAVNLGNGEDNTTVQVVPAFSEWNASLSASIHCASSRLTRATSSGMRRPASRRVWNATSAMPLDEAISAVGRSGWPSAAVTISSVRRQDIAPGSNW